MRRILLILAVLLVGGGAAAWWFLGQRAAEEEAEWADFDGSSSAIATTLRGLPGDSFAAGSIANLTRYADDFALTEIGRMMADPQVRRAIEEIVRTLNTDPAEATRLVTALQGLAEMRGLGVRSLAMAAFPIESETDDATGAGAIVACDDPRRLADWLDGKLGGAGVEGNQGGLSYVCHDSLCRAVRANTLLIGSPLAALLRVADDETGLAESTLVEQLVTESQAVPHGFFGFVDLQHVVAAVRAAAADEAEAGPFFEVAGLDALQLATYTHQPDGDGFMSRLDVRFDGASSGLLPVLLDFPVAPATVHEALPADMATASFGHLDDPANTFDRLLEEIRKVMPEEDRASVDQSLGFVSGLLGIDLRNDVFAAFQGELGIAYTRPDVSDPQQMLNELRWLMILGLADSAPIDRLLDRLTPFAAMQGQAIKTETLGDGSLRRLATPMPGGMSPVIAVADGRLVAGSLEEDVRAVYDGGPSLADDPRYQQAMRGMPEAASWWGFASRPTIGVRSTLELALNQKSDDPALQGATYRSLTEIASAVEAYRFASGDAPAGAAVPAILDDLVPQYAAELLGLDGWEQPLGYAARHDLYVIWSIGSDGEREQDWARCVDGCNDQAGTVTTTASDLVIANGEFIRWPAADGIEAEPAELAPELAQAAALLDARLAQLPPAAFVLRRHEHGLELLGRAPFDAGLTATIATVVGLGAKGDEESP